VASSAEVMVLRHTWSFRS